MAKKNFSEGIESFLGGSILEKPQKKIVKDQIEKIPLVKTSFRTKKTLLDTIRALAYWERKKVRDVLEDCLQVYIDQQPESNIEQALENYKNKIGS